MSSPEGSTVTFRGTRARPELREFARRLERDVTKGRAFDCLITGNAEVRRLNRDYRNNDYTTDVLSFPAAGPARHLGDVAISLDRARVQARAFGHSLHDELRILMLHGVLHLMGYDHEIDSGRMARAEKRWRTRLGLPVALIERVA